MQKLSERFRGGEGAAANFAVPIVDALTQAVRAPRSRQTPAASEAMGRRLGGGSMPLPAELEAVNLDRADALWSVLGGPARPPPFSPVRRSAA